MRCALCWSRDHTGDKCAAKNEEFVDNLFEELVKSHRCIKCPECKFAVEKIDGCNNIICRSPICKGLTNFCYGCGINFK